MKKIISTLLVMLMLLTMLPFTVIATFAITSDDFEYSVISETDKTCTITKYTGSKKDLVIPSQIDEYIVTVIGWCSFEKCTLLTSITIPNSVTRIADYAFRNCTSLKSIKISEGVTSIGSSAFEGCTSLTNITIPNSVTSIDASAFGNCTSLTSITIPDSVTSIVWSAFNNTAYYNNQNNWENDVLYIGNHLIKAKESISGAYAVKNGTKTISNYAFVTCTLLTDITIPEGIKCIRESTFDRCTMLKNVTIPSSVTYIETYAFRGCTSLTSIALPESLTSIDSYAFNGCKSLVKITMPNSVTRIGVNAFSGCISLTSITIPDSVVNIESSIFSYCTSLASVTISNGVTRIGRHAFDGCTSLTSITIPDSVTRIESSAFEDCTLLKSIIIPDSVESIGDSAFNNTAYYNDQNNWENNVLYIGNHLIKAKESISNLYTVKNGTKTISDYAFRGCVSLTSITIPNSVTSVGSRAFSDCTSLTSITIPNGVMSIGSYAFKECTSLSEVIISDSVKSIGESAFNGCILLTNIIIPNSVTSIGDYTFEGCPLLVIYGYSGSCAEIYADENNIKFVPLATVSSISIQSKPTKTVYTVGEKFDASGLKIKVTMSDGTTKTITSGFTVSNPDMSTAGTKTVTVSYSGKTTTFTITVKTATTGTLRAEISNRAVLGQTVDIPIYVDCNAALGTIKFHVQYDKTKLQYVSCNENAFKNSVVNDNDPGKLVVACVTDGSVPAGKICVLRFKVIASSAGNTNLNFSAIEATDSVDAPINMSGGSYTLPLVQRYTVTYNANGGTGAPAAQTKYTGDSLKLSSVKPTRTGYTFLGWATSATATSAQYAAGGTYTGNANLTLYAVWKANTYTVTYNANGGKGATASSSHTYDTAKALTANGFTRTGYTFLGWSTSASATTATYTNKQSVKNLTAANGATVTLYAVWQKNPATVSSIAIQSKPTKTVYTVGEKFDASGLKVKVTMSDGTTKTITSGFTLSNPDMSKAGTKSVTVTYSGKTVSFTITVKDANPPANTGALRLITPASARVGQRVQIPVQLDKASLGTLTFTVKYDHTKLKYVSCTESTFDMCDVYAGNTGVIRAACIDNDAVSAGHIAVLTFEVIAPSACLTDLTLVVEEAYDGSDKAVSVTGGTWELSVVKTVLGDLNGDGQVTAIDARWALQAASGTRTLNEEQKAAADINGDGKITAIDARWILQAASGTRVF